MSATFRPHQRLLQPREFSAVFSARRLFRGEWLDLHHAPTIVSSARLGLVIPKRLAKHAVLRNTIRRQAREVFRKRAGELPIEDMVLRLARPLKGLAENRDEQKRQVRADIERLLARFSTVGGA